MENSHGAFNDEAAGLIMGRETHATEEKWHGSSDPCLLGSRTWARCSSTLKGERLGVMPSRPGIFFRGGETENVG